MPIPKDSVGGIFGQAASFTPAGFAANVAAETIATPNTSAATGGTLHGSQFGAVNVSRGFPWYAWLAIAAVAVAYFLRK